MKLLGIGTDIVETDRIARSIAQFGSKFLDRIFLPGEIQYCSPMRNPTPHYAARFAAKEAISKAFGTGIGDQIGFIDIEVRRKASGEPFILLHGSGKELARRRGVETIQLSLSHTELFAVAFVTLLGKE